MAGDREHYESLKRKLQGREAISGVIGLGYVGLPLVRLFLEAGCRVYGFDTDPEKIRRLEAGESYIKHIDSDWLKRPVASGQFRPTAGFSHLREVDCVSICVPTPLDAHLEPDLQYIRQTAAAVGEHLRPGQLIALESTTYPGTTEEVLRPALEAGGLKAGEDFFLVYTPERENPGARRVETKAVPKVLGGVTPRCAELGRMYYGQVFERIVEVSSPAVAEMTKLLENIFRSVNIALVNELKMLCQRMGIDVWEVIEAAATKPFGFMPFYPGPGLGGHCIPIDPFYLSWKAREYEFSTRFIELAGQVNTQMPAYVVTRVMEALNERGRALKGAKVLVLGVAYKPDVDDLRESPGVKLIELLRKRGAIVAYNDPHIPRFSGLRRYDMREESVELSADTLAAQDCVLIATAHSGYDMAFIVRHAPLVVDTRNATRHVRDGREKIVKA